MPWPSREEIVRLLGLDLEDEAVDVCASMRSALKVLREEGIDVRDHDGHFTDYTYVASEMYWFAFGFGNLRMYHDQKRHTVWFLGRKPREDAKDLFPDIRMIYSVRQNSRHLKVYAGPPNEPAKRILAYDMQDPRHRQSFMYVRQHAAQKLPIPEPLVRKDLLKVQQVHVSGKDRRSQKEKRRREISKGGADGG